MNSRTKLRIGTRKSRLSLRQTQLAVDALQAAYPDLEVELHPFQTRGDVILDRPLWELSGSGKGVFASEFEQLLLRGEIDLAVHSGKDLPLALAEGLEIVGVLRRADPRDVLILPQGRRAEDCRSIGTGSLRRQQSAAEIFPWAQCRLIRGNIHTRLQKLDSGEYDAIVLAKAGLDRMGITERDGYCFRILSPEECLPAACQGMIVLEGRKELADFVGKISHAETMQLFETERAVLTLLNADCSEPVAAFAERQDSAIRLRASYGKRYAEGIAPVAERLQLAADVVRRLKE